jgi:O-antigen/teichoic acid export membrane protein
MPLYANSIYLVLNSALSTLFRLLFWVAAARLYPPGIVGRGKAVVSVAGLLTFAASLGLGISIIRFLPVAGTNVTALISLCFTISGLAVVVAVVVFLVRLPVWSPVKIKGMAGMEEG